MKHEETENLDRLVMNKENESAIVNLLTWSSPRPEGFNGNATKHVEEINTLQKLLQTPKRKKEHFQTYFIKLALP